MDVDVEDLGPLPKRRQKRVNGPGGCPGAHPETEEARSKLSIGTEPKVILT